MADADWHDDNAMSFFTLGTTLLRNRWRILAWGLISATMAAVMAFRTPPTYIASASFIPQGYDAGRSGVAGLAGQLGITVPTGGGSSLSPEFYSKLLRSRALLTPLAKDTFAVAELGGRRIPFVQLAEAEGSPAQKDERALKDLTGMINVNVERPTGVVEFTVASGYRSLSLTLAQRLIARVNEYNLMTTRSQAEAERRFVEDRLGEAGADLREAENRLERFLATNRQFNNSPELRFEQDRIQRDVTVRQEVFASLRKAYEEVRIREVRDTPGISVFEAPSVPTLPAARGRVTRTILGFLLGIVVGILIALMSSMVARRKEEGDPEAEAFVGTLGEVKGEILRPVRWVRGRVAR